ncbi:Ulp1 family isopeptidase [Mesorhizobium silamurunense]|uniref:Ulp1 family isopeptidase n=1 Tax=Mesorhizobium silamurunense TaxID=499528 RepID=UPI001784F444|nr:Ulp1 family isopeptidase [Mesorhizobium silamurunense]
MDNSGWGWPYNAPEQNDPNADVYSWVANLTGIGGTTDDYMRHYRAMQEQHRARQQSDDMPAVEQQLSNLQLNSADESSGESSDGSSGEASSPDTRPAQTPGRIQRTDFGGSMRMPRQSDLQDNQFSNARHSVDTSHAASSRSRSRHSAVSSEAYSSSLEEPVNAPQPKKRSGWKSFLKTVKKAIVPTSGKTSSKDWTHQPDVTAKTTYRIDYAKRSHPRAADENLIADFTSMGRELTQRHPGGPSFRSIELYAMLLRKFSAWLQDQDESPTLASLLDAPDDPHDPRGLTARAAAFANEVDRTIDAALAALQQVRAGLAPERHLGPYHRSIDCYPDDARLIGSWASQALANLPPGSSQQRKNCHDRTFALRKFSEWLKSTGKVSIASRLKNDWDGLNKDRKECSKTSGRKYIKLQLLREHLEVVEAIAAGSVDSPEQPAWDQGLPAMPATPSEGAWDWLREEMQEPHRGPQVSSWQGLPATPASPSEGAWDWLREQMQESAPPSSARARSSDIYGGLESLIGLPSTPHELRDDARSAPAWDGASSSARPMREPGLPDIGYVVGQDWRHGSRPATDLLIDLLENARLAPTQYVPTTRFLINGELYTAELQSDWSVYLIHDSGGGQADAQASGSGASLTLGDTQWLGDEHIHRDYQLLQQELQESNPDLAARTRFVDPLVAHTLREGTNSDAGLDAVVRGGRRGNDTADFLFLPVNDASATGHGGSHWSLLLLDRRNRKKPVAYHYDSSKGHNFEKALRLARKLNARLVSVGMTEQDNGYDCGVFVVDGTRALVGELAREQPLGDEPLSLGYLDVVADRAGLQERLRGGAAGPARTRRRR